jgi:peptide/nickel transport system permease protein
MKKTVFFIVIAITLVIVALYKIMFVGAAPDAVPLTTPNMNHWFGVDINGHDLFLSNCTALMYELFIMFSVLSVIWMLGLFVGGMVSYLSHKYLQVMYINAVHYMATLPVLLVALFLLIMVGPGIYNSIFILTLATLPTQSLYAYYQFEMGKNEEFYIVKKSYGFSKAFIYKSHLFPFVIKRYNSYTISRASEIMMLNIALNFLGVGLKESDPSIGRLLYDGLAFMFSAWHLWVFPVMSVFILYFILKQMNNVESF